MSLVQSATGLIIIIIITTIIMSLCLYSDKRDLEGFFLFHMWIGWITPVSLWQSHPCSSLKLIHEWLENTAWIIYSHLLSVSPVAFVTQDTGVDSGQDRAFGTAGKPEDEPQFLCSPLLAGSPSQR